MPVITHRTLIDAPIELCFDIARDVEIHTKTVSKTKEKAVSGVTAGLLNLGDTVTWEAVHFGVKQRLTAKIIEMERPYKFVDVMVKGTFKSFTHTHEFVETNNKTQMIDTFEYKSPFGLLGILADKLFLKKYMNDFILNRCVELKKTAESMGNIR